LPANGDDALICSFECTYCRDCATRLDRLCPNCGGRLEARPSRPQALLGRFPASAERVLRNASCSAL